MSSRATQSEKSDRWANLRMVGMHPIRGIDEMTRYREHVAEFPFILLAWMRLTRLATFMLFTDILGLVMLHMGTDGIAVFALTYVLMLDGYSLVYKTRFDVWTPAGFHLFKWMITVRS